MNDKEKKFLYTADKVILVLSEANDGKYYVEREIVVEEDGGYSRERGTLIYEEGGHTVIEKNVETGEEERLAIPGLEEIKEEFIKEQAEGYYVAFGWDEDFVRELFGFTCKYLPNGYDISFRVDDCIYVWCRNENKVETIVPCEHWLKYYWLNNGNLLYLETNPSKKGNGLVLWDREKGTREYLGYNMEEIIVDEERNRLYGVQKEIFHDINLGYYADYKLVEINLETGEERESAKKENYSDENTLALGNHDQLFYVSGGLVFETKHQIYYVDVITGKSKCIYRTDNYVIEMIVE
ncbi:MAG: hypothetical protein IJP31_05035 [Lachnospiraceae bacterium]|nr:hypothetical protein [Lachnospiraceae bacterium]